MAPRSAVSMQIVIEFSAMFYANNDELVAVLLFVRSVIHLKCNAPNTFQFSNKLIRTEQKTLPRKVLISFFIYLLLDEGMKIE